MNTASKALSIALLAGFFFAGPGKAESTQFGDLKVETPWARASIGTARPAAAYMTIRNGGSATDQLVGVESPVSGMAEIHKVKTKDGVVSMSPAGPLPIGPGETVALAPGGLHVMLMKLRQPLEKGARFPLTLTFERAGKVTVDVPIHGVGAIAPEK
ncbi:copper chaperone PCu(A)C [Oceanibaculum pacificum]|uniref:Copper chaperone PCu(A)C n=1 Tax=Oceanibaculum pacificum TaxID=580166 RepID=A0A154WFY1_9PROT|nr:copper chaperone PCu(A)C [Oceanibaculum pacificum]KZD12396.1 hypothetical protein AUP43_16495 [Oceanibaculum pacificum]